MKTESTITLPQRIRKDILGKIASGAIKPNEKLSSEHAVAESYGVNRATARQALMVLINEGVLHRERGKGTFVTERKENAPKSESVSRQSVAVVVPTILSAFYSKMLSGCYHTLSRSGCRVELCCADNDSLQEREIVEGLLKDGVDGVILAATASSHYNADLLKELAGKIPLVLVDRAVPGVGADFVHSDDRRGAYYATSHLIELGHKRIAHICAMEDRFQGYRDALDENGIDFDPELVRTANWQEDAGYVGTRKLLLNAPDVTAIFAYNDTVALGVYKALDELEISMRDRIAVVGYGDSDVGEQFGVPLTTVDQSPEEMGRAATRLLTEKLSGRRDFQDCQELKLPTKLVVRQSCGIQRRLAKVWCESSSTQGGMGK